LEKKRPPFRRPADSRCDVDRMELSLASCHRGAARGRVGAGARTPQPVKRRPLHKVDRHALLRKSIF
jgi:hypothetical protein